MYGWTGNSNPGPLHKKKGALPLSYPGQLISIVLGQTTTLIPFQSFCPLKNNKQMFTLSGLNWFYKCLIKDGHRTKWNTNERKYRNKHFLHRRRKMCENIFLKKVKSFLKDNTDPIPHLHPCTSTWTRKTCGPNIGINKEVESFCISLFDFIKTHLIFESLITKRLSIMI